MDFAVFTARFILSGTFAFAGFAKLANRAAFVNSLRGFGLPAIAAPALSWTLPLSELAVSVLLIALPRSGGIGAIALLAVFSAAIAINLMRGRRPECQCFGQVHSSPVGWRTLCRNGILASAALLAVVQGDAGHPGIGAGLAMSSVGIPMYAIAGCLGVLVAQAWFASHLLRQHGRILQRLDQLEKAAGHKSVPEYQFADGLPVGSPAPRFRLPDRHGREVDLDGLLAPGHPLLLVFSDPDCAPCQTLLPQIAAWEASVKDTLRIAVVSRKPENDRAAKHSEQPETFLFQHGREIAELYEAKMTPSAVIVAPSGVIASRFAVGPQAIAQLGQLFSRTPAPGQESISDRILAGPLIPGAKFPNIELRDLDGATVSTSTLTGQSLLLLFWNPECPHCVKMLPQIREWERNADEEHSIVMVSSGSAESNKAMQLQSRILLDTGFRAGTLAGASGTPSGVLIGPDGTVRSPVVIGAADIAELAAQWARHAAESKPKRRRQAMVASQSA